MTRPQPRCTSYPWTTNLLTYTASGNYDNITTNANGCKDTVTLQLTINNGTHTTTPQTACISYTWPANGVTYTTSGNYNNITTNANGCKDTVTLQLTINNGTHTTTPHTTCISYTWSANGVTYTTSGNYNNITNNAHGCKDTVTLQLTINNGTHTTTPQTACISYTWPANGLTYTTSGNYNSITANAQGCKDTVTLQLTINNGTHTTTPQTACISYTWPATGVTYTTSGNYDNITTNANGCKDTVTLQLTINNGTHTTTPQTACISYTWPANGDTYTTSGKYNNITTNA